MARRLLATAVAVLVSACGDPTAPASINGRYTLRLVDGQPLPRLLVESRVTDYLGNGSATVRDYLDGGTLVLLEPQRDTLRLAHRTVLSPEAGSPTTTTSLDSIPFHAKDDRICVTDTFSYDDLTCDGGPRLERRGDTVFVDRLALPSSIAPARFAFVREGR